MDERPYPQPDLLEKLTSAVYPSFAALAAMGLDLFTPLKDGPLTASQIAETRGMETGRLAPLLYALVAAELLSLNGDLFANSPEADRYLVSTRPSYIGDAHKLLNRLWPAALRTAASIRAGVPRARHEPSEMSSEELEVFLGDLHRDALETGRELVRRQGFEADTRLLDVGGGSGGLAIAVAEAVPGLRATVVELPAVAPITKRFIRKADASRTVRVQTCNAAEQSPVGSFDVAVLKSLLQTLSPGQAQEVVRNVGRAIRPGGRILILGAGILDNTRVSPKPAAFFNIVFLNLYHEGQAYTEQEYAAWLSEAGFERYERTLLADGSSILEAKRPEE